MFSKVSKVQDASRSAEPGAAGLATRLKDPQVWVCAIAAFTLIGLSSGLLGAADPAPQQQAQLLASAK